MAQHATSSIEAAATQGTDKVLDSSVNPHMDIESPLVPASLATQRTHYWGLLLM